MREADVMKALAAAGLNYLGMADESELLMPPEVAALAASVPTGGQDWAVSVENDAPDFREQFNHGWYMLCADQGLFDRMRPQFYIAVPILSHEFPGALWWAQVQLQTEWDLAGAGAETHVTGRGWGYPEFVMLSLDGDLVVQGARGEVWTDVVCLHRPQHIQSFRDMALQLADGRSTSSWTRSSATHWLEHTAI